MGNDMFNEEQLAHAAGQQASRERESPPAYILTREAFLRRLHVLADTRPSNDGLIPAEVDLSAHDAALRLALAAAERERDEARAFIRDVGHNGCDEFVSMDCGQAGRDLDEWCWPCLAAQWIALRSGQPSPPARETEDGAVKRLLTAMYLYPNYRLDSRGPAGLILDAIEDLAPDVAKRLRDGASPEEILYGATVVHRDAKPEDGAVRKATAWREFARDCRDNWDHDMDAHAHNTPCRKCEATALLSALSSPPRPEKGEKP